ncbi:cytochrome P450 [Streptomyces sp. HNM0663]|uniref:Cytochrome P450 n=1 Tax=Streptomyces chengmaiensis TaxID=3040919 RepID=A0ABT6HHY6_9ACTN|nr:cytochrome P450 [Streptomyces chengmaiensis]MDH2388378.1 cytochrome P450 [Streptomyces chengmaiensis]
MTASSFHQPRTTSASEPPPGCPAHARSGNPDGLARLFGPEAAEDPMGLYERLRARHGPVAPVLLDGDLPAWIVLGYREILEVVGTPSRFSRDSRIWRWFREGKVPQNSPLLPMIAWQPVCLFLDGEERHRLRLALNESLERFNRRGIRRHITRFTHQLVDDFAARGEADLADDFAEHLPMLVMTQLLGMPDAYGPQLVEASRDMVAGTETSVASNDFIVDTLQQLTRRKREKPGDDVTSWLLEHSSKLTDEEVWNHLRVILIAANETTVNLLKSTLRMVLTDPRCHASLAGGQMTLPDVVEQVLWSEPPLMTIPGRWAAVDTEVGGQKIEAGDMLLLGLGAGNHDPAIRPDLSVPLHGNRSHLAFSSGPQECPGQDIGRAIADTGIDTLLTRLPDLQLSVPEEELHWQSGWMTRHLTSLPVKFTPPRSDASAASAGPGDTDAEVPRPLQDTADATGLDAGNEPLVQAPSVQAPSVRAPSASAPTAAVPTARASWWDSLKAWLRRR